MYNNVGHISDKGKTPQSPLDRPLPLRYLSSSLQIHIYSDDAANHGTIQTTKKFEQLFSYHIEVKLIIKLRCLHPLVNVYVFRTLFLSCLTEYGYRKQLLSSYQVVSAIYSYHTRTAVMSLRTH
jgi:hypothetical protein